MAKTEPPAWLTAKRLKAYGTVLALALWLAYGWNLSTPGLRDRSGNLKGTDFLHFYTLGSLADAHDAADLYDMNAQAVLASRRVPQAAGLKYLPLYPPQLSLVFAPLAETSYGRALALWWAWTAILYAGCCYWTWRACLNLYKYAGTVLVLTAGFPAFFHLIAWGQTSALALLCFTALFFLLRSRRDFLAGLVLGCLVFKPQLGLAAAIVFLSIGAWRVIAGSLLSAAAQMAAGAVFYGTQSLKEWFRTFSRIGAFLPLLEPRPYQTHSLRTFWSMLMPWLNVALALYVLSAVVVLAIAVACWRRGQAVPLAMRYSVLLLATVLVAPHLTVYDLVILAPAILVLADWIVGQPSTSSTRKLGGLLFLVYILPLVGPLARWTHIQLSVIAMASTVYVIFSLSRQISPTTASVEPSVESI